MPTRLSEKSRQTLNFALNHSGLKSTRQREHVFGVLMDRRDHPTADEVFTRSKEGMPTISLATVYNCLEALVECGLVRQVNIEREPTRYCPNLAKHAHFHCKKSGRVYDIDLNRDIIERLKSILPKGFNVENIDISFRGDAP